MPSILEQIRAASQWPEVAQPLEEARAACTRLRFHGGLHRRMPEAALESRVRGGHASATLEGARSDINTMRLIACGHRQCPSPPDPMTRVARGALLATFESARVAGIVLSSPRQGLARLNVAAAAGLADADAVGRPRVGDQVCAELPALGPGAHGAVVPQLIGQIGAALQDPSAPALLVAALVHGALVTARPFICGNAVSARALTRAVIMARGLDPTGVCVVEAGHAAAGAGAYLAALQGFARGDRAGVGAWIDHCAAAVVTGADQGVAIAEAVRAGRVG